MDNTILLICFPNGDFHVRPCPRTDKLVELVPVGKAMEQLKARDSAVKDKGYNHPIHLVGVEFSKESSSVVGFVVGSGY